MKRVMRRMAGVAVLLVAVGAAGLPDVVAVAAVTAVAAKEQTEQMVRMPMNQIKWERGETLPKGFWIGVLRESPRTMLVKFPTGGKVPRHWHTASGQIMVLRGAIRLTAADGTEMVLTHGGYASIPGKAVHASECESAGGCLVFETLDGPFDIAREAQ